MIDSCFGFDLLYAFAKSNGLFSSATCRLNSAANIMSATLVGGGK
jgi:hypothetical protein